MSTRTRRFGRVRVEQQRLVQRGDAAGAEPVGDEHDQQAPRRATVKPVAIATTLHATAVTTQSSARRASALRERGHRQRREGDRQGLERR